VRSLEHGAWALKKRMAQEAKVMNKAYRALRWVCLEALFVVSAIVVTVLTVVDLIAGCFRYLYGRVVLQYGHYNPWEKTVRVWRLMGAHVSYVIRSFQTDLSEQVARSRQTVSAYTSDTDLDYVDEFQFFALLPVAIGYGFLLVHCIIAIVTVISLYGVYERHGVATPRTTPEVETVVAYVPQVADQQEMDFGPWLDRGQVTDRINDQNFLNIALLSDTGSVKYSQTKVSSGDGFSFTPFHERVVNPHTLPNGQVEFSDQHGKHFVVNKKQAFMFEGYATKAFMFDQDGKLTTVAQTKIALR
jgi:hypothetical protein